MQTFVMLGKYSADSVKGMSPKRTQKTEEMAMAKEAKKAEK